MDDVTLDAQIDQAIEQSKNLSETEPRGVNAWFDTQRKLVFVELQTGVQIGFPINLLQGLSSATDEQIAAVELSPEGYGLWWTELDAHHAIPGLVAGVFGNKRRMSELGRKGGSVKSEAKAKSSRENGKLGGRPKKIA